MLTATIVAALAVVGIGTGADANGQPRAVAAVPDGFQQYLTCLAQPREVDEPTVVDYESFKTFQAEVWGRDQDAIDALRAEAITFYAERFGLDFSEAAVQPDGSQSIHGATLVPSFVAPETEYRAYTIGGRWTPPGLRGAGLELQGDAVTRNRPARRVRRPRWQGRSGWRFAGVR